MSEILISCKPKKKEIALLIPMSIYVDELYLSSGSFFLFDVNIINLFKQKKKLLH